MSMIQFVAILVSLLGIAVIALDLLLRPAERRTEGDRRLRDPLPEGIDPVQLRKRRPLTQRMSGAVLAAAVLVILIVVLQLR